MKSQKNHFDIMYKVYDTLATNGKNSAVFPRPTELRPDSNIIIDHFIRSGIKCFNHVTHVSNIQSIKRNGIYSYRDLVFLGIPTCRGGNDISQLIDRRSGNDGLVHLSVGSQLQPMFNRRDLRRYAKVVVDIGIAGLKGVVFSNMNATSKDHIQGETIADLKRININAVKAYQFESYQQFKLSQAEVMVPYVPKEYIIEVIYPIF
ncbi:hypothetical protein M9Y10_039951 [Tritrichomonas musculus]|uniref:DarT domain-containing protein n=1 Tax=Tritrichomonas musculus TaxID=1915356 RepID=A0ABR2GQC1_9EUKA